MKRYKNLLDDEPSMNLFIIQDSLMPYKIKYSPVFLDYSRVLPIVNHQDEYQMAVFYASDYLFKKIKIEKLESPRKITFSDKSFKSYPPCAIEYALKLISLSNQN
jgi:hypothetical protein